MKLLLRNLNPDPCLPHTTSTYICKEIIALRMCGGCYSINLLEHATTFFSSSFLLPKFN